MVFKKLKLSDLKSSMLVSKKWKDIIEDPNIWKKFVSKPVYPEQVGRLLNIPRLCLMKKLELRTGGDKDMLTLQGVTEEEFQPKYIVHLVRRVEDEHVLEIQKSEISELDISNCDFIKVDPDRLGDFLNNLETLKLHSTVFTPEQLVDIFEKMSKFTNLEKIDINLKSFDVTKKMEEEVLAKGLNKIRTVNILDMNKQFLGYQIIQFFQKMSEGTEIKYLDLTNAEFPFVPEDVLAKALNNLETLKMTSVTLSRDQAKEFYIKMKDEKVPTKLKHLEIDTKMTNINSVDGYIISKALVKVSKVTLRFTYLNFEQLELIFRQITKKYSKLTELNIWTNDLSGVPADILAGAVNTLTVANLKQTKLTKEQASAIFTTLMNGSSKLDHLDIGENDLSEVDPSLLAKAVNRLKFVRIGLCSLTKEQTQAVFDQILVESKTTFLDIEQNSTEELSAELCSKVDKKVKVQFGRTKKQKALKQLCSICGKGPFLRLRLHKCRN